MVHAGEQLHTNSNTLDIFRPSGFNDSLRIDLGDEPFIAIDPEHPHEIDDAIRVQRFNGNFLVQSAIADGAQVLPDSPEMKRALNKRENIYADDRVKRRILPFRIVKELELSGQLPQHRALVVSQAFSADGTSKGPAEILPATIRATSLWYPRFARYVEHEARHGYELPIVAFDRAFRAQRSLRPNHYKRASSYEDIADFSSKIVQTYMVLANMAIAGWAVAHEVPILYREFDPEQVWDEESTEPTRATYTPTASTHAYFRNLSTDPYYTHSTSPLRRGADLVNHAQIAHFLAGRELPFTTQALAGLGRYFSQHRFSPVRKLPHQKLQSA